jgi:hypothetical protein
VSKEGEGVTREERIRFLAESRHNYLLLCHKPSDSLHNWLWAEQLYEREEADKKKTKLQREGY